MNDASMKNPSAISINLSHAQGTQVGNDNVQYNIHVGADPFDPLITSEPAYLETIRVINGRTDILIDRQLEMDSLATFARGGGSKDNYFWLTGTAWAGKTALLANAALDLPSRIKGLDVLAYFLIARESQASYDQFLAATTTQLAFLLGIQAPSAVDIHVYRNLWARACVRAEDSKRRLLLIVDGLDEDTRLGGRSISALLPTEHLSRRARVLISSRPHMIIPDDVDAGHPLRRCAQVDLSASPYANRLMTMAQQEINSLLSPPDRAYEHADLPFEVLGLLATAAGALTVPDIASITGMNRRTVRSFLNDRASRSLQPMEEFAENTAERRYQFAHQTLLEYSAMHPDIGVESRYRNLIYAWADSWKLKKWPTSDMQEEPTPAYLLDSYPAMLAQHQSQIYRGHENANRLGDLVSDANWVDAALTRFGTEAVLGSLLMARRLTSGRRSVTSMLRALELAGTERSLGPDMATGYLSTKLILGALRSGETQVADAGYERLETHSPPYLVPTWTESFAPAANYGVSAEFATRALAFAGDYLISAGTSDGAIRLHELTRTSSPSRSMGGHVGVVLSVANLDSNMIASGGVDGTVRLWEVGNPGHRNFFAGSFPFPIRCLAPTRHGGLVAGVSDGGVYILDETRRLGTFRPLGHHDGPVRGVSVGPDGCIVSASQDGTITVWDPDRPGAALWRLQHRSAFLSMAMTQARQVVTADLTGQAHVWNLETSRCTARFSPQSAVRTVAITSGGQVICGCSDGAILLWGAEMPQNAALALTADRGAVWALAAAPNGRIAAANHDLVSVFQLTPIIGPDA